MEALGQQGGHESLPIKGALGLLLDTCKLEAEPTLLHTLRDGEQVLLASYEGAFQGDCLGPVGYCAGEMALIREMANFTQENELKVIFGAHIDDWLFRGDAVDVLRCVSRARDLRRSVGLDVNHDKLEFCSPNMDPATSLVDSHVGRFVPMQIVNFLMAP